MTVQITSTAITLADPDSPDAFTVVRKTGDALIIAGMLTGGNLPSDTDWAGATVKINITDTTLTNTVVNHGTVTFDEPSKGFVYSGAPIATAGTYFWELEVTFTGLDDPITWPNSRSMRLVLKPQLA